MSERTTPLRIRAFVGSGVVMFVVAVVLVAATLAWNARKVALADGEAQGTRFVAGAEAALNRSLLAVDVLLASTDELLGLSTAMSDWIDPEVASQRLRSSARQNLMVRYVAVLDGTGKALASSDASGGELQVQLPLGFLAAVMGQPVSTLMISAPVISFASSERVLYVARYLRMADSSLVVAVAELPVAALSSVLVQGVDINGLQVTLERAGGQLLLSVPNREEALAPTLTPRLVDLTESGQNWDAPARLTGEPGLVVYRPILYQDLRIAASIPRVSALAGWRDQRNAIALTTALFVAMILAAGGLALRYLSSLAQARMAIAQSKATLDQALESMVSGFMVLDRENRVVQWNSQFEHIYPWLKDVMVPLVPFRRVMEETSRHHLPRGSHDERMRWVEQRLLKQKQDEAAHEQTLPNGRTIQITERPTPDGGLVITYHDVTALRQASAEIESLAFYDPLTNLPNRRLLMDRMQQAVAASVRSGQYGALLFLDLDHFKTLNDTLGHEVGDMLLRQVAQRLKTCVRREDTVARLGGDEFVVMLHELSVNSDEAAAYARRVGEKILRKLNVPYTLGANTHHSTPSIGATLMGGALQPTVDLLKQADIAMYQVKSQGRNALCFFDPQMQIAISARAQLEGDLQQALTGRQFVLHYQPQFHLDGRVVGAEALIRWHHPERGLIAPGAFISVAEESELIVPMGHWVLRTACEQLSAWENDARYRHVQLSVNVSARQFRQRDFVARVVEVLRETGARPHLLKLELTESLVLDNVDDTVAKMGMLKTKGVRFSVDDFGTGYSSLAYLTRLPLDQLKIDQSFVHNLGVRHTDDVIVQTIIGMARNLELDVIAEGVETQAQKDFLALHGCQLFQGYLMGRPTPVAALEALLDNAVPVQG
ncbi:MAG: EAL domain-containing protein [Gammaproteobacteria bacterium]|nr:EAL domain-containing protein [Gammaproteobacteria bacterium]MBU1504648.1 EAL domain-containing protein [Gammaproteobacteria bacterium]MBU2122641.1 EAL domain-containing protein [Gammaproteobacteria bacterium]MBU2171554.1 EAL domain-containing protein [Gammaproteobacteria bacterium]MBU2199053.1 EAL domain-containing protein [Gammaproteobacteria bacterium]